METRKIPLQPNNYYHIYNRGVNGQNIFMEERNYSFFLQKYSQYVFPFFDTYAYCLLKNHFHLLVRARSEEHIRNVLDGSHANKETPWILSNAFSSLFKSYAQAINKACGRTGALFEEPFHRIQVKSETYFSRLVYYIHQNPEKHGFIADFKDYVFSSYQSHLLTNPTKLERNGVLEWFGGKEEYRRFHSQTQDLHSLTDCLIEF